MCQNFEKWEQNVVTGKKKKKETTIFQGGNYA